MKRVAEGIDAGVYSKPRTAKTTPIPDPPTIKDKAYFDSIRQHVATLKNPNIDRSCSFQDYLLFLNSHAEQFAVDLDGFGPEYYPDVFVAVAVDQFSQVQKTCNSMMDAISAFISVWEGKRNETAHQETVHGEPAGA